MIKVICSLIWGKPVLQKTWDWALGSAMQKTPIITSIHCYYQQCSISIMISIFISINNKYYELLLLVAVLLLVSFSLLLSQRSLQLSQLHAKAHWPPWTCTSSRMARTGTRRRTSRRLLEPLRRSCGQTRNSS